MPRSNFRSARQVRGSRRIKTWSENTGLETLAAGAAANRDLLASYNEDAGTVIRLLLNVTVQNWAAVADVINIGTLKARAADIGSTPLLATMPGLDWSFKTTIFPTSNGATVNVLATYHFDLKSKRRFEEVDERYLVCFSNGSAASKTLQWASRTLVLEP
jgi:hypothetical protein